MNCSTLFVAALAASLGACIGHDLWKLWIKVPIRCPEEKSIVRHVIGWILLVGIMLYICYLMGTTVLF